MKTVAIIQARMGSTRLPGKVLMDLGGDTVLARVVGRVGRARRVDECVVATTDQAADLPIAEECARLKVRCFRGSETDVLDRFQQAAATCAADVVVRITADCPLIDPEVIDATIEEFIRSGADYASNVVERTFPRGLDTEVFRATALERACREAREAHEREHVTPYLYGHPEKFRVASLKGATDESRYRWTLDTPEDLRLLRAIYSSFGDRDDFGWRDAIALMKRRPELAAINAGVVQKSVQPSASHIA